MKQKVVSILLTLCLLMGLLPGTALAVDQTESNAGIRIVQGAAYDSNTGIFSVKVQAKLPSGTAIRCGGVLLSYDNTKLTLVNRNNKADLAGVEGTKQSPKAAAINILLKSEDEFGSTTPYSIADGELFKSGSRCGLYTFLYTTDTPQSVQKSGDWFDCYEVMFRVSGKPNDPATVLNNDSLRIADSSKDNAVVEGSFPANNIYNVYVTDDSDPAKLYVFGKMSNCLDAEVSGEKSVMTAEGTGTATYPGSDNTPPKPALEGSVTITGTPKIGEALTATPSITSATPGALSYQWYRVDGSSKTPVDGATGSSYTPNSAADVGKTIGVEVSAENYSGSVSATTTGTVAKADGPSAPTGLVEVSKTDTTITVTANSAWEYSRDNGSTWQPSNTFTGLTPNTAYSIVARVKATATHEASAACSAISITTAQATADDTLKNTLKNAVTAYTGVYDGTAHNAFSVGSLPTGWTVQYASSESGSYSNTVPQVTNVSDSGTLWVKFSNSGYSDVVTSYSVSVTARDISGATITLNTAPTYSGMEQTVTIASVKVGSTTLANTDYEIVTGTDKAINVASKTLKITGKGNYKGTAQADWTLQAKDISSVTVTVTGTYTYTGALILPAYMVTDGSAPVADSNYTAVITDNTNAGTATITLTGKGNYTGTKIQNFTIGNAAQTITVPTAEVPVTFGSSLDLSTVCSSSVSGATLTFALKSGSTLPTGTNLSSDGTVTAGTTEGTFVVAVNAAAVTNYDAAVQQEFTVKIVNLPAASVTTAPAAKTGLIYNGMEQTLITAGTAANGALQYKLDGGAYSVDLPKAKNAGNYTVYYKVTGDAAHSDSAEQYFTVTVAQKDVTVKPKDVTITKGDAIPAFALEYTGLVSGDTLTPGTAPTFTCYETGTTPVSTTTAAGTYTITWANPDAVTFTDTNYNVTKTATGTLTISSPASSGSYTPTYGVTVDKTEHGSVSVSTKTAAMGSTVTVTVTPDKGYVLETLTVLDQNGKELKLTEKDGKYTFTMPAGKVTVKATFMDDSTMLNYFVDVKAGDYFYDAVLWAVRNGITTGTDATHFSPDAACTRAQIVTFLWRAAGSPEPKNMGSFADVPADSYYAKAVAWAVENGITGGTGDGKFSPDAACTREQAVTFLYRASGSPAVSGGSAFTDVAENAYYANAVAWAQQNGVTGGIGGGLFGSGNDCTRAQIVTFLYRAYQGK